MLSTDGQTIPTQAAMPMPHPGTIDNVHRSHEELMRCILNFLSYQSPDDWIEMLSDHLDDQFEQSLESEVVPPMPQQNMRCLAFSYSQLYVFFPRLKRCYDAYCHYLQVSASGLSPMADAEQQEATRCAVKGGSEA